MKVDVYMRTYAHYTNRVELSDDELERIAADLEKPVNELTADDIRDLAEDKAFTKGVPGLCHMEKIYVGDDWETPDETQYALQIVE